MLQSKSMYLRMIMISSLLCLCVCVCVLCSLIDWKQAFDRQCPTLGVQSFVENGVRNSLIPLLINYFQDRYMIVKWHDEESSLRKLIGGGL